VNGCEVATPPVPVTSVSVAEAAPFTRKVPLGPAAGAVKITVAPLTGDPFDVTVAVIAPYVVVTVALAAGLAAVIAMIGALELELQPVRKIRASKVKARKLA